MLGILPKPFPDELLHSLLSRMRAYLGVPPGNWGKELFGIYAYNQIDLPGHIEDLVALFPPGNTLTVDDLVDGHTNLPFHTTFMDPHRVQQARGDLIRTPPRWNGVGRTFGNPEFRISPRLRFCPACADEDKRLYGEPYWHRLHQIPCVLVCPTHGVFLEDSTVRTDTDRGAFTTAADEVHIGGVSPRIVNSSNRAHLVLLEFARDVEWLLNNVRSGTEWEPMQAVYLEELQKRRLASSRVDWRKLPKAILAHYPEEALNQLGCAVSPKQFERWMRRVCNRGIYFRAPVWHLLLIHFLGYTVEEFFAGLHRPWHPFGEGPWPCLNKAATHFRAYTIVNCDVEFMDGRPRGTFRCQCGFDYRRYGDRTVDDRFRFDSVYSYGYAWEKTLRSLWEDPGLTLKAIANRLGIHRPALQYWRQRLLLPQRVQKKQDANVASRKEKPLALLSDPAWETLFRTFWADPDISVRRLCTELSISQYAATACAVELGLGAKPHTPKPLNRPSWPKGDIQGCREVWLSLSRSYPHATRSFLVASATPLCRYLRQHDLEWLEQHLPRPTRNPYRVDWAARDQFLSSQVPEVALRIKNSPGRPEAVKWKSFSQHLGTKLGRDCRNMLPLTVAAIEREMDSRISLAIRRLWWRAEQYREQGKVPTRWDLTTSNLTRSDPEVQAALAEILASFGAPAT